MSLDKRFKYLMSQSVAELADSLVAIGTYSPSNFPNLWVNYDVAWQSLFASMNHLKRRLGDGKYAQLIEMAEQAKAHFDRGRPSRDEQELKLGAWLMIDMERVIRNQVPFAYPREIYRWPRPEEECGSVH